MISEKKFWNDRSFYIRCIRSHLPLKNRAVNKTPRSVQSANIPIHTAIGPNPKKRIRHTHKSTRQNHIVRLDTIMENFTSPAARIP